MEPYEYRRALHRAAEVGQHLPKTQRIITNALKDGACELSFPWESAVCAYFDFGFSKTTALRADMDALPVCEDTGLKFCSENRETMHACGHDGHMAMLLGTADMLTKGKIKPKSNILLIFQPAEETTGGAKPILDSGLFEKYNVSSVFGMHLIPDLPKGALYTRPGAMMAKSCEITVDISGRSTHIAKYAEGADALAAAAEFLSTLYRETEKLTDIEYKLLRFGKAQSGSVRNAVSASTRLEGSLRCFDEKDFETLRELALRIAKATDAIHGTKTKIHLNEGYPPLINDEGLVSALRQILPIKLLSEPRMITDDFSWYQKKAPGVYIFLGTGTGIPLHSPDFDFDESILDIGINTYKIITENL